MALSEKIKADVEKLPEALQEEVLDFVEYLLMKASQREDKEWLAGFLATAMQGMEDEGGPEYTEADLKEIFHSDGFLLA
jgi:hypothetical protein